MARNTTGTEVTWLGGGEAERGLVMHESACFAVLLDILCREGGSTSESI